MAGQVTVIQQLMMFIFIILLMYPSVSEAVHCYDCEHCEKIWSTDEWKSVDCGNASCAKRVVSGYVAVECVEVFCWTKLQPAMLTKGLTCKTKAKNLIFKAKAMAKELHFQGQIRGPAKDLTFKAKPNYGSVRSLFSEGFLMHGGHNIRGSGTRCTVWDG